jgi:acyl-CoA reductase-like NAD-dependent aldehyde dehydrogenase
MASSLHTTLWQCNTLEKARQYLAESKDSPLILQNYISDTYTSSSQHIDSFLPQTGALYAKVPLSTPQDVDHAVLTAEKAFKSWSKTTRIERSKYLQKISRLVKENRELFAVWESIDQGKTVERARIEVDRAVSNFSYYFPSPLPHLFVDLTDFSSRYFSTYILHEESSVRLIDGVALTYEHRSPAGVFALISPWNMPLYLLTWKIAPCLAFGCTAVAKPSEVTSMSAFCE